MSEYCYPDAKKAKIGSQVSNTRVDSEDFDFVEKSTENEDQFDSYEDKDDEDPDHIDSRMQRIDDVSGKLGQYMLQGWTLLGVHCTRENCGVSTLYKAASVLVCPHTFL